MSTKTELLQLKGAITELSEEEQVNVKLAIKELREITAKYADYGMLALVVVGLETALENK